MARADPAVFAADPELHQLEADYNSAHGDDDGGAHEPLLNGRPTASMELSEIERELALAAGPASGHGEGGGAKGTLMEGIANVRVSINSTAARGDQKTSCDRVERVFS